MCEAFFELFKEEILNDETLETLKSSEKDEDIYGHLIL